ncbi:MAG: hypothetical protein WCI92_16420 [Bacteroidota bacterium]
MGFKGKISASLRKAILLGWAFAVVWIYLGNLVNFHQHHIWGKQLIPVACSSTRAKEKDSASFVKNDGNSKSFGNGQHFDFSSPDTQVCNILQPEIVSTYFKLPNAPVLLQGIQAFSLRGPPSA